LTGINEGKLHQAENGVLPAEQRRLTHHNGRWTRDPAGHSTRGTAGRSPARDSARLFLGNAGPA